MTKEKSLRVKCGKKRFMGVDQYGETYHNLVTPRQDLMRRLGASSASKMYVDSKSGGAKHTGYVIKGRWISIYEVCEWKKV